MALTFDEYVEGRITYMKIRNSLLVAIGVLLLAGPLSAASMTPEQTAWGRGAVQYLMTKQEMDQWKSIGTAEEAQKFIDLFWAKRDSDLTKPAMRSGNVSKRW